MTHNPDAPNTVDTTPFVLTRTVNAPRDLVWRAFTERECLAQWLSPTGMTVLPEGRLELRPGGLYHYGLRAANGFELWAKWTFQEITAPERLVYVLSFSDPQGGNTRHPMAPDWPMEMLSTITLTEQGEQTLITLQTQAINATASEQSAFNDGKSGMTQGWSGTFDQLDTFLADVEERSIVTARVLDFPREQVFAAWTQPELLASWWGPKGFTNTFEEFDLRPGGHWRFTMHGPDGKGYPNHSIFSDIVPPQRIVFDHVSGHHFEVDAVFTEQAGGKTRLTWRMRFDSAEECAKVRAFVTNANEENMDKLQRCLEAQGANRA